MDDREFARELAKVLVGKKVRFERLDRQEFGYIRVKAVRSKNGGTSLFLDGKSFSIGFFAPIGV